MPTTRKQILHTRKLAPFRLYLVGGVNDVQSSVQFALIWVELSVKKGREGHVLLGFTILGLKKRFRRVVGLS